MTKAIIVHQSPDVHAWITDTTGWDTQVHVPTIQETWNLLGNGTLSSDSEVVLFSDELYNTEGDELASVIAQFAPVALVVVISEDPALVEPIKKSVANQIDTLGLSEAPFYFLDTSADPGAELERIIEDYTPAAPEVLPEATETPAVPSYATPVSEPAPAKRAVTEAYVDYSSEEISQLENTLNEPGIVLTSTSSKGGSGKSTVALCTAITLSIASQLAVKKGMTDTPLKVIVVDMDVKDGQIGFTIDQTRPSVLNYFSDGEYTIPGLKKSIISVPRFGIDVLLAPARGKNAAYLSPEFYRDIIHNLRLVYDVVVLDTSVNYLDPLLSGVVYPESDGIIFVTNLSKGAVFGIPRWMDEVVKPVEEGGSGVPKNKIGVVINQSMGHVGMDIDLLRKSARNAPILVSIPADSLSVVAASNEGRLNELISTHELIGRSYYKLVTKLWRDKSPLVSPIEEYLNSPDKARDDMLASSGKAKSAATAVKPQSEPAKKSFFSRK